jgi:transcriptional regulator with XRE-family HTH domain
MSTPKPHPLKIWRRKQRPTLSQRKLAAKIGCSDMTVLRWERGSIPRFDDMAALLRLTGLTANDFHEHRAMLARRNKETRKHG